MWEKRQLGSTIAGLSVPANCIVCKGGADARKAISVSQMCTASDHLAYLRRVISLHESTFRLPRNQRSFGRKEKTDQAAWLRRLIWVIPVHTCRHLAFNPTLIRTRDRAMNSQAFNLLSCRGFQAHEVETALNERWFNVLLSLYVCWSKDQLTLTLFAKFI